MDLLILSEENDIEEKFEPYFDKVEERKLSRARLNVSQGEDVTVDDMNVEDFDCLFVLPEVDAVIYLRSMLEMIEKNISTNLNSLSLYMMIKKQYLYKVLNEKSINIPKTVAVGSEKSAKGIEGLDYPAVGRKYVGFEKKDMNLLENQEEMINFAGSIEYGKESAIIQELAYGEVFDCLVIGDEVISLKLSDEGDWDLQAGECTEKYHKAPSDIKELVRETGKSVGMKVCRVKVVGGKVVNVHPIPQLERFKEISGKDTYKKVAELLKGEE